MYRLSRRLSIGCSFLICSFLCAQTITPSGEIGIGQAAFVTPATSDEITAKIVLRGLDAAPTAADLEAGVLISSQQPNLQLRPIVTLVGTPTSTGKTNEYQAELKIRGLLAFGESSVPLLYKGRQIDILRFSKPGLFAKPPLEGGFVAREGSDLRIVFENPTSYEYKNVRARLRFEGQDVCQFTPENFRGSQKPAAVSNGPCEVFANWTAFDIPRYAQMTLKADPARSWFRDPETNFARSAKKKGLLTVRFQSGGGEPIYEQNLPIEIQFEPAGKALLYGLIIVVLWLFLGAGLSLFLRVSVPNLKRKRLLKERLNELAKQTASISAEVDSNLRVLLRVERLALDEIRTGMKAFGPSYADYTQPVEQALPALKRQVDAVRRLDAGLIQKRLLQEQGNGIAPTRLEQIESLLSAVSETLKQEQLSEENWVFINQRLETAQKLLREPTQTEKEAFEAMLSGRWKIIREHFRADDNGILQIPHSLQDMQSCFPDTSVLPDAQDKDGSKWIQSVGPVRADLQISALQLVYDYQFLAPADAGGAWQKSRAELNRLLSTPAIDNLRSAKSLLRQLAEGVEEKDILEALKKGDAMIVMDPVIPRPNQKIRFSVRFRKANLNTAAARELVTCRWDFADTHDSRHSGFLKKPEKSAAAPPLEGGEEDACFEEYGWYVHHYFESDIERSDITVSFYDREGKLVAMDSPQSGAPNNGWCHLRVTPKLSPRGTEKRGRLWMEILQLSAALVVPLLALASATVNGGNTGHWWDVVAIGFASDTIKNILVGRQETAGST